MDLRDRPGRRYNGCDPPHVLLELDGFPTKHDQGTNGGANAGYHYRPTLNDQRGGVPPVLWWRGNPLSWQILINWFGAA